MNPSRKPVLALEQLEDRTVPSASVAVWPDPGQLTLSFVPDGALIGSTPSDLSQVLVSASPSVAPDAAEVAILQAFQTWAVHSNINIGVVPDDGAPLGSPGAVEGDPRFGAIRIAAEPLSSTSLATTTPYAPGSPWSGTVVINSNQAFTTGNQAGGSQAPYDLFTTLLHEAGLLFGQSESTDPTSAMDEQYQGPRTDLSAADVQNLQAVYGPRTPDANATSSFAHPVQLRSAPGAPPGSPLIASGALSTNQDVDTYQFRTDQANHPAGVDIQLQAAGLSLLTPSLSVYDATGNLIAASSTTDPLDNNLSVHLAKVPAGATYFLQVSGADSNVFGIGSYRLTVNLHPENNSAGPLAFGGAPSLTAPPGNPRGPLTANGTISANQTSAVYHVRTPAAATPMTVSLQSWGLGMTPPTLTVCDRTGKVLGTAASTDPLGGNLSLTLARLSPNTDYYLQVQSGVTTPLGLGAFRLQVDMQATASPATSLLVAPQGANQVVNLQALPGAPPQGTRETIGSLRGPTDSNFFRVRSTNAPSGQTVLLTASVLSQDPTALAPQIAVYDSKNNPVKATVLDNEDGNFVVQVAAARPNQNYLIQVKPGGQGNTTRAGNYFLSVTSGVGPATTLQPFTGGTLTATAPQSFNSLTLTQNTLLNFALAAQTASAAPAQQVWMFIYDALGNLVFALSAAAGQPAATGSAYLAAGTYTVQFTTVSLTGAAVQPVTYSLAGQILSSPIGPTVIDPTSSPTTTTTTTTSPGTVTWSPPSSTATGPVNPPPTPYTY